MSAAVDAGELHAKPLRADAVRNREALLVAAGAAFAEHGTDTPLEHIAKSAGVGIGTLYRHFPTREDLIASVYRQEVEVLSGGVDELLATLPADQALAEWMRRFISYVAVKRGLIGALKETFSKDSEVFATAHDLLYGAAQKLIDTAVGQGTIRPDAQPDDLLRGISGFCMVSEDPGWQDTAQRLATLLVDGLRFGAPSGARPT